VAGSGSMYSIGVFFSFIQRERFSVYVPISGRWSISSYFLSYSFVSAFDLITLLDWNGATIMEVTMTRRSRSSVNANASKRN
jgi:hypothetical protein